MTAPPRGVGAEGPRGVARTSHVPWSGLVTTILALLPGQGLADEPWTPDRRFGLHESTGRDGGSVVSQRVVAALTSGSVLLAQAGGSSTNAPPGGWQFTIAPYLWTPRAEIDLAVGNLTRSTTLDFSETVDDLRFGFTTHFEAAWRDWTLLLDVLYFKLEKDETTGTGVQTEVDLQEVLVEFGGTYRFATLPIGRTGRITFEALTGGRLMWVDTELSIGAQLRVRSTTLIDPMVGGRIAYRLTDTVAFWLRGDAAGFGISDSQSQLSYNLIAGFNWRFTRVASVVAGWRYMHVDIEKGSGASRLDVDLSMNGPFLGFNFYF
jgi:opacity protein-like surface antigen